MNRRKFITTAGVLALGIPTAVLAADVTLQWNKVAEADGYKIYWGTDSRFLVCCSGDLVPGPHYESEATIAIGTTARLDVNPDPGVTYMQIVTVDQPTVVTSPLDVLDVDTGMLIINEADTYYFAVTAYNSYGESEYSEEVNAPISGNPGDVYNIRKVALNVPPPPGGSTFTKFHLNLVYG